MILQYKRTKKAIQKLKSKSKGKLTVNIVDDLLSPSTYYRMVVLAPSSSFRGQEFQMIKSKSVVFTTASTTLPFAKR
ncbi:hypothetical protein TYRP_016938 [Tyrophagus putrescentiae]|nr:hypothetical protein TYRP_016938 [Tyrophagus putrescentiae]